MAPQMVVGEGLAPPSCLALRMGNMYEEIGSVGDYLPVEMDFTVPALTVWPK
jgi:hypothetical protein